MTWTLDATLGPLSFQVTEDDPDHMLDGAPTDFPDGQAWLVDRLRIGWRYTDTPPARPEPLTASLTLVCHPPALLRDLDEGQVIALAFDTGEDAGADVYFAGRIGAPLSVSTFRRNGILWGRAQIEAVDYTVDLATLTLSVPDLPDADPFTRLDAIDAEMTHDAGVGLLDPGGVHTSGVGDQSLGFGLQLTTDPSAMRLQPVEKGRYAAGDLIASVLNSIAASAEPLAGRFSYAAYHAEPYVDCGYPLVVPVVDAAGQLDGFMFTAIERVSTAEQLPATLGLLGSGKYGLVEGPDGTRFLLGSEIRTSGAWIRERTTTRVTASHRGAAGPVVVTLFDPDAGDARIVSRDVSTDLIDYAPDFVDAAYGATFVAHSRLPTPAYDRLGWKLDAFLWHPRNPGGGAVLRAAIPDHRDTTAWSTRDVHTQPWLISGVDPDLAFSDRLDYAGQLESADFILQPAALAFDYALNFTVRRRVPYPEVNEGASPDTLSAAALTGPLATIDAGDLDPALTFTDLALARKA